MKRILIVTLLAVVAATVASDAFALSFTVDVPYQFTLDSKTMDSNKFIKAKDAVSHDTNGFILGVSSGWFGLGYEKYDVAYKGTVPATSFDFTLTYQFYDVFVNLPFPSINPVIGVGKGTVNWNADIGSPFQPTRAEPGDATQMFARLGIPIGPLFDLHLGYHRISVEDAKFTNVAGDKLKSSGSLWTLGARLGW